MSFLLLKINKRTIHLKFKILVTLEFLITSAVVKFCLAITNKLLQTIHINILKKQTRLMKKLKMAAFFFFFKEKPTQPGFGFCQEGRIFSPKVCFHHTLNMLTSANPGSVHSLTNVY